MTNNNKERLGARVIALLVAVGGVFAAVAPAHATFKAEEVEYGSGETVISAGHIDFGPVLRDGKMQVMVRDDSQHPAVWRDPQEVVLAVTDTAKVAAPDDPDYGFLGVNPGSELWVLPQTQQQDIVWPGWNTQHPELLATVTGGTTMRLQGVTGPGNMLVYVQEGNFGKPKELFNSAAAPQEIWVDYNTHAHANWVFTAPGVYGVQFEFVAAQPDGSEISASAVLQFAVGSATAPQSAFGAAGVTGATAAAAGGVDDSAGKTTMEEPDAAELPPQLPVALLAVCGVLAMALAVGLVVLLGTKRRQRQAVLEATVQQAAAAESASAAAGRETGAN